MQGKQAKQAKHAYLQSLRVKIRQRSVSQSLSFAAQSGLLLCALCARWQRQQPVCCMLPCRPQLVDLVAWSLLAVASVQPSTSGYKKPCGALLKPNHLSTMICHWRALLRVLPQLGYSSILHFDVPTASATAWKHVVCAVACACTIAFISLQEICLLFWLR